jgi:16S rRNA G1207 methylase RsmC
MSSSEAGYHESYMTSMSPSKFEKEILSEIKRNELSEEDLNSYLETANKSGNRKLVQIVKGALNNYNKTQSKRGGSKKHTSKRHKTRKHKTRKHKTRKHKTRKHKTRKHKTRK